MARSLAVNARQSKGRAKVWAQRYEDRGRPYSRATAPYASDGNSGKNTNAAGGCPPIAGRRSLLRFLLPVFLDILIHLIRECKLVVDVAGVRVVGVWADGEVLLSLPLEDTLAARRVVAPLLDLLDEGASLMFIGVAVPREQFHQLLIVNEVACDHSERQPAIVADILALVERVQQVTHHRARPQIFNGHSTFAFLITPLRVRATSAIITARQRPRPRRTPAR